MSEKSQAKAKRPNELATVTGLGTNIVGFPYDPPAPGGSLLLTKAARKSITKERPLMLVTSVGEEVPEHVKAGDILLCAMEPATYDTLIPNQAIVILPYEFVLGRYDPYPRTEEACPKTPPPSPLKLAPASSSPSE